MLIRSRIRHRDPVSNTITKRSLHHRPLRCKQRLHLHTAARQLPREGVGALGAPARAASACCKQPARASSPCASSPAGRKHAGEQAVLCSRLVSSTVSRPTQAMPGLTGQADLHRAQAAGGARLAWPPPASAAGTRLAGGVAWTGGWPNWLVACAPNKPPPPQQLP